jgi:pimeloyl-ACP methyl ester carboxylesterase
MNYIELEDKNQKISALDFPGEGKGVVFLHGLFDSAYSWRGVAEIIKRPSLALDIPGFGMSAPPGKGDFRLYAQIIHDVLSNNEYNAFHLVGHSMGALLASHIAHMYPSSVSSLSLLNPLGFARLRSLYPLSFPPIRKMVANLGSRLSDSKTLTDFAYAHFVTRGEHPDQELLDKLTHLGEERREGILRALEAIERYNRKASLPENFYQGSVFSLWGERDPRIPIRQKEGLLEKLPQAKISVWANGTHHPQNEDANRLADELTLFFPLDEEE